MAAKGRFRKGVLSIIGILSFAAVTAVTSLAEEPVSASVMRLSAVEGTVDVEEPGGKKLQTFENMRLHSGYALETGQNSYAGLTLDSVKAVKMDALSKASVKKTGKKLELLLTSGSLLCDVKEPLGGEETLNIRTSTAITGIRGTVVYVRVIDENTSVICVLEGQVHIRAVDPDTGKTVELTISAGQQAMAVTGQEAAQGLLADIRVSQLTKEEIDGYVLALIAQNPQLAERLRAAGWDTDWMISNADRRLEEDRKKAADILKRLENAGQESGKSQVDQMYMDVVSDSDSSSSSDLPSERGSVVLTMPVSAAQIDEQLRTKDVILRRPDDLGNGVLRMDHDIMVPKGGRLEIRDGIELAVIESMTLQIEGTLVTNGSVGNTGTIKNTSWNTLNIGGNYTAEGGILENSGRMIVGGELTVQSGSIRNDGGEISVGGGALFNDANLVQGDSTIKISGNLSIQELSGFQLEEGISVGGTLYLMNSHCILNGGTYEKGIVVEVKMRSSSLKMTGGSVGSVSGRYGIEVKSDKDSNVELTGGTVYAVSGAKAAVKMSGGELNVTGNVLILEEENIPFMEGPGTLKLGFNGRERSYSISNSAFSQLDTKQGTDGWEIDFAKIFNSNGRMRLLPMFMDIRSEILSTSSNAEALKEQESGKEENPDGLLEEEEEAGQKESLDKEEDGNLEIKEEGSEGSGETPAEGSEGSGETPAEGSEGSGEAPEEGSGGSSGTQEEGSGGSSGTQEEGSGGSSGTQEEGSGGSSGTQEEGSGGSSGTSEEGSGGSSGTQEEGSGGSSGTQEEGSGGSSGTSEEGSGGNSGTPAEGS